MQIHRTLVLDDDSFMLKLLVRALAQLGETDVLACETGEAALRLIDTSVPPVDLILLDVNMPEMDGVEFTRRLADRHYAGALILVSGEASRTLASVERLIGARQLRCLGALTKPVDPAALATLLNAPELVAPGPASKAARPATRCSLDELRGALARREFVVFYQPQVSMAGGEVTGVECLVRWHDSNGLMRGPDQFIELAETAGLIGEVTRQVLTCAARDLASWRKNGLSLRAAINISMGDLEDLALPDTAVALVESAGVDPASITLEVTETKVMSKLSTALDVLTRLRLKRFGLAIDDFGTGHSSLVQLRDLPFDELKIDRGFVHGAGQNATLHTICNASLRLAQQLRLRTVAEGIETPEDWVTLRDLGCEHAQGYWIAKPMASADLPDWITRWNAQSAEQLGKSA